MIGAELGPVGHELAAFVEQVAPAIGSLVRMAGALAGPITEGRGEAVRRDLGPVPVRERP